MQELNQSEIDQVGGGYLRVLMITAEFLAGYAVGKALDKLEGKGQSDYQVTPEMEAVIAGNMGA